MHNFRMEHREKPFKCFICKEVFEQETPLHSHLSERHADVVGPAAANDNTDTPCAFCRKRFLKRSLRLRHTR